MSSTQDTLTELVDRYLAGESTPEEQTRLNQLLVNQPNALGRLAILSAKLERRLEDVGISPVPYHEIRNAVRARGLGVALPHSEPEQITEKSGSVRGPLLRPRLLGMGSVRQGLWQWLNPIVASVLSALVVLATTLGWYQRSTSSLVTRRYTTHARQRLWVTLPDGSEVLLAPRTTVTVTNRSLDITGEAFFTVAHASAPFVVRTANATARVLGTRFDVRHYPNESESRILVDAGRIAIEASQTHRSHTPAHGVLSARMLAAVTDSGITVTSGIAVQDYISWTQGTVVFSNVPLHDLTVALGHLYGVEIQIPDAALASHLVRMNVSLENDTVPQILDVICTMSGAHYTRRGTTYVLSPGRASVPSSRTAPERRSLPQPELQYGR